MNLSARAYQVLLGIRECVPPCVIFCLLSTWCNAWCTKRRFQSSGPCVLCQSCDGEDSLEHYAECPFQWQTLATKLRKPLHPQSLVRFLALAADDIEEATIQACHIYAVKRAVDIRRVGQEHTDTNDLQQLIWHGHRTAALYHSGLAKMYRKIWQNNAPT
eukprot:2012532-Karenia_brevis.AAC.1